MERALIPILAVSSWSDFEKFLHLSNKDKNSVIINEVLWEFSETTEEEVMSVVPSKWAFNRFTIKLFFQYVSKVYIHRRIIGDAVLESFGLYTNAYNTKALREWGAHVLSWPLKALRSRWDKQGLEGWVNRWDNREGLCGGELNDCFKHVESNWLKKWIKVFQSGHFEIDVSSWVRGLKYILKCSQGRGHSVTFLLLCRTCM